MKNSNSPPHPFPDPPGRELFVRSSFGWQARATISVGWRRVAVEVGFTYCGAAALFLCLCAHAQVVDSFSAVERSRERV